MMVPPPLPDSVKSMEGFDSLPAPVRTALCYASFPFAVAVAAKALKRGRTAEGVVDTLAKLDQRKGWKGGAA